MRWAIVGLALAGCSRSPDGAAPVASAMPATLPACGVPAATVALPDWFPRSMPLPPGSATRSAGPWGDCRELRSASPGAVADVHAFLLRELPRAGYAIQKAELEADEAEIFFEAQSAHGVITLHAIAGCAGATEVRV